MTEQQVDSLMRIIRKVVTSVQNKDIHFETYEEYKKRNRKYNGKCFVHNCDNPGYYEGGDSRFYCGMCEKHAQLKEHYVREMCSLLHILY